MLLVAKCKVSTTLLIGSGFIMLWSASGFCVELVVGHAYARRVYFRIPGLLFARDFRRLSFRIRDQACRRRLLQSVAFFACSPEDWAGIVRLLLPVLRSACNVIVKHA